MRPLAAAALGLVLLAGPATGARQTTISLALQGGHTGPRGKACGLTHGWTYYRLGGKVRYHGYLKPEGPAATAKIVVKRCFGKRFDVVKTQAVRVRPGGEILGSFRVRARSDCFLQASASGATSPRLYFRVR